MSELRTFKLVDSDELVGELVRDEGEYVVIKLPCKIVPTGPSSATFVPWLMTGQCKEVQIQTCHIMYVAEVKPEVEAMYKEVVLGEKGIIQPDKELIL